MTASIARYLVGLMTLTLLSCGEVEETLPGGAKMKFVYIEPGTFVMGSPASEAGRFENEGPQHDVTLSKGFYLGKYEVTQAQWQAVMGSRPWVGQEYMSENPDHPAVYVSWYDVQGFIHKLNVAAGDSLYRLPSEAEWEYACRAGTTTPWSFGDDGQHLKDYTWYVANTFEIGEAYAHRVGTKKPNAWQLHDMHGNVWEWVQDWAGVYSSRPQVDPAGAASGSYRVIRGGYFYYGADDARCANRSSPTPFARGSAFGFRVVRRAE